MKPNVHDRLQHKRFWLRPRYGLRTLLIVVSAVAALFGWESYITWQERRAAREIERLYGTVEFESIAPAWLRRLAGQDYLMRATSTTIHSATTDDAIRHLRVFGRLESIFVVSDMAGDTGYSADRLEAAKPDCHIFLFPQFRNHWLGRRNQRLQLATFVEPALAEIVDDMRVGGVLDARPVVVRLSGGRYRYLVRCDHSPVSYPVDDYALLLLFDGERLVDWKQNGGKPGDGGVETAIGDVDGDGVLETGFQAWRLPDPGSFDPNTIPEIDSVWLELYRIRAEGFEPVGVARKKRSSAATLGQP